MIGIHNYKYKPIRKICEMYGEEYIAYSYTALYCPSCREKRAKAYHRNYDKMKRNRKQELPEIECKWCGTWFKPAKSNQLYCSHKCARAAQKAQMKAASRKYSETHLDEPVPCRRCGKMFIRSNPNARYCDSCAEIVRKYHDVHNAIAGCVVYGKPLTDSDTKTNLNDLCAECFNTFKKHEALDGHCTCVVCGKAFTPNSITYDCKEHRYHVAGQVTCSIGCTDKLYGYKIPTNHENGRRPERKMVNR